jgi:putative hydrolase of the HAD superfamily
MSSRPLLVTDADNTLWQTDEVFATAQLDLLQNVEEHYGLSVNAKDRLQFVREIDQALALRHPKRLMYPANLLVQTIVSIMEIGEVDSAINQVLQRERSDPKAESIANTFTKRVLNEIPRLRDGVATSVLRLAESRIRIVVFTEGNLSRCERLLEEHRLSHYLSEVISGEKTAESYAVLRRRYQGPDQPLMVGDQIDRDIELSKIAGFRTVHFPGGFNPVWTLNRPLIPDFVITNYEQVLTIMGVGVASASAS